MIRLIDVQKSYTQGGAEVTALSGVSLHIARGEFAAVMGPSGSGKSTLLHLIGGLDRPSAGDVVVDGKVISQMDDDAVTLFRREKVGFIFQFFNLLPTLTGIENVALPLETFTTLSAPQIGEIVSLKLALVGLAGFEDFYPSEVSGGMMKRAGVARAMALDPDILFFDEPSAGLDPISSRRLDDLILELRASLGATMVVVTHELPSIFAIADNSVFLDGETRTMIAYGNPRTLRDESPNPTVRTFLRRGAVDAAAGGAAV